MMKMALALRKMRDKESGFTLIELMVVVVIIGILAAIAIPQFANIINNSRLKADIATGKTIKDAVDQYYTDKGSYPSTTSTTTLAADLKTAGYLASTPTVAQNSNGATLDSVITYTPGTGEIQVHDFSQSSKPVVWDSNS